MKNGNRLAIRTEAKLLKARMIKGDAIRDAKWSREGINRQMERQRLVEERRSADARRLGISYNEVCYRELKLLNRELAALIAESVGAKDTKKQWTARRRKWGVEKRKALLIV